MTDTIELGAALSAALARRTGRTPHVVICHLRRAKVDMNRQVEEATLDHPTAVCAFDAYHGFIETARQGVEAQFHMGIHLDVHGQSHREKWIEFGYLVRRTELKRSKTDVDHHRATSSLRHLATCCGDNGGVSFHELIRGERSLGGLMEARGYRSVPSPANQHPGDGNYFSGGYTTQRHGSRDGGTIDSVQVESPRDVRHRDPGHKDMLSYAGHLADSLLEFFSLNYPNGRRRRNFSYPFLSFLILSYPFDLGYH